MINCIQFVYALFGLVKYSCVLIDSAIFDCVLIDLALYNWIKLNCVQSSIEYYVY